MQKGFLCTSTIARHSATLKKLLKSLSKFFAKNSLLNKNGLMALGPSNWFNGNDMEITDFLLSDRSRPVGLVVATFEDVNGYRTHNIVTDCKNRLLFDPDKFYDNKIWPLTRETLEKLQIKKIHSAKQINVSNAHKI